MPIVIVDSGTSNLHSVKKALQKFGENAIVTRDKTELLSASGIILPGVGSFDAAMKAIRGSGLEETLLQLAAINKPFLGICLGLQILFDSSEEGSEKGLGIISGTVKKFRFSGLSSNLKVPHMGWNGIQITRQTPLLEGIEEGSQVYFVHSYYVEPKDKAVIQTTTDYGITFASSINKGNLYATQFHLEKSGDVGLKILSNFVRMVNRKEQ